MVLSLDTQKGATGKADQVIIATFKSGDVSPWVSFDVGGAVVQGGARGADQGCLEVYGGGTDIARNADQFHFLYQGSEGNASLVARVAEVEWPGTGRVGLMLREDLTPGSRHVSLLLQNTTLGPKYSFLRRETANGLAKPPKNSIEIAALPSAWLKLERQGNDFIGSWSTDGATWIELSRVTLALPASLLGGIATNSRDTQNAYVAMQAKVCDVSLNGSVAPPPPPTGLVATAGNGRVELRWDAVPSVPVYAVSRSTQSGGPYVEVTTTGATIYIDTDVVNGTTYYHVVRSFRGVLKSAPSEEKSATPAPGGNEGLFRRGDADASGTIDVTDAVKLLNYLFLGGPKPECLDAADFDNSDAADISDAVANLSYQFLGGPPSAAPGPTNCGPDPTSDALGCDKACP